MVSPTLRITPRDGRVRWGIRCTRQMSLIDPRCQRSEHSADVSGLRMRRPLRTWFAASASSTRRKSTSHASSWRRTSAKGEEASGYYFLFADGEHGLEGYACLGPIPGTHRRCELYWIAVDPDARRRGLGRRLQHAAEDARARTRRRLSHRRDLDSSRLRGRAQLLSRERFHADRRSTRLARRRRRPGDLPQAAIAPPTRPRGRARASAGVRATGSGAPPRSR